MRVLVVTQPGSSVFFQVVPLATALRDAGHEVRVATAASFAPAVEAVGLSPVAAGLDWLESATPAAFPDIVDHVHDPHGALVRFMVDVFLRRTAVRMATDVAAVLDRWRPDVVLHGNNEIGGPAAAASRAIPHLMLMAGLDNWVERIQPALSVTDEARAVVGLAPARGDRAWLFAHGAVQAEDRRWSSRTLDGVDVDWLRPVSPAQPASDLAWIDALPRPLVHVTLGTVFNKVAAPLFAPLAAGAAASAASVVVTVGTDLDPSIVGDVPANVHVRRYVPLDALLARCDAVLAHGGWGTLIACAAAGLPLGAIVLGADQGFNAAIAERAGFGFAVRPAQCTAPAIAQLTRRLLHDEALRVGAERQRASLAAVPSPADVARTLARRFGERRGDAKPSATPGRGAP